MKGLSRVALFGLLLLVACFSFVSSSQAEGLNKHFHRQGPKITTPTRAFIKRQCDAMKRGIGNIPGMKKLFPNCKFGVNRP